MNWITKSVVGLLCAVSLFSATKARADIPPPEACQTEHAACHNAGDHYDQDGVCTAATCSKGSEQGQVTTYDCFKCEASTVSEAGASNPTESQDTKAEGGCGIGTLGSEKGVAYLTIGLGFVALGISRRRR